MGLGTYDEYVQKYGKENAEYIVKTMGDELSHYKKIAYIDTGVGNQPQLKQIAAEKAARKNWQFEVIKGDVSLLLKLVNGEWDRDSFLVVKPGSTITSSYDEGVIK